jgi:hypothetical protein
VGDTLLRPFWVCLRGDVARNFQAHHATSTNDDLVLTNAPAGRTAGMVVAHFPLEMIEAWGEGASPPQPPKREPSRR